VQPEPEPEPELGAGAGAGGRSWSWGLELEPGAGAGAGGWSWSRGAGRIGRVSAPDCIFCKIVAGELPASILAEDERTLTFMDVNPATAGHALVIPRRHARDLLEIEPEDLEAVVLAAQQQARRVKQALGADGVNLINSNGAQAWQTVFHFHVHVVPRYAGDPLKLPWIPTPGDPGEIAGIAAKLADR
jgi:histidine triad (HIT) family protein